MGSDFFKCLVMDWDMFYDLAKKVSEKINDSVFKPDIIIGLARGGWVLARVLCDLVGVKDLVSLKVEHWGVTATPDGSAKLSHDLNVDICGKMVLVVDDITDTGESMQVAVEYIKSLDPSKVKTATLQHITGSKFKADYIGEEIDWVWVVFPWNFTEDMCTIVPKVCTRLGLDINSEVDFRKIRNELKQNYTINTTEETIEDILQEIKRRNLI
jgi:hypoxanthine phosphoribosyltransferase